MTEKGRLRSREGKDRVKDREKVLEPTEVVRKNNKSRKGRWEGRKTYSSDGGGGHPERGHSLRVTWG